MKVEELEQEKQYYDPIDDCVITFENATYKFRDEEGAAITYGEKGLSELVIHTPETKDEAIARLEAKVAELEKRDFAATVTQEVKDNLYDEPTEPEPTEKIDNGHKTHVFASEKVHADIRNEYIRNKLVTVNEIFEMVNAFGVSKYNVSKSKIRSVLVKIPGYVKELHRDFEGGDYTKTGKLSMVKYLNQLSKEAA